MQESELMFPIKKKVKQQRKSPIGLISITSSKDSLDIKERPELVEI